MALIKEKKKMTLNSSKLTNQVIDNVYIRLENWDALTVTGLEVWREGKWTKAIADNHRLRPNHMYRYVSLKGEATSHFMTGEFLKLKNDLWLKVDITYLSHMEVLCATRIHLHQKNKK